MQDGALNHPLESQRGLGVDLALARHFGRVLVDERAELFAHGLDVGAAGAQNLDR